MKCRNPKSVYNNTMPMENNTLEIAETSKKQSKKMSFAFKGILSGLIAAFSILAILAKQNPYFGIDLTITQYIQSIQNPIVDSYLKFITMIGNPEWAIAVSIMLGLILIGLGKSFYALFFSISVIGLQIISFSVKYLVARPRPDPELINQLSLYIYHDSFPSGHVSFFIGCFGFIAYLSYTKLKSKMLKNLIVSLCTFLIATIGISRIYVGAHWFSDTLGAYIIGGVWLYMLIYFFQKHPRNT